MFVPRHYSGLTAKLWQLRHPCWEASACPYCQTAFELFTAHTTGYGWIFTTPQRRVLHVYTQAQSTAHKKKKEKKKKQLKEAATEGGAGCVQIVVLSR